MKTSPDPDLLPVVETISASRRLPGWRRDWHAITAVGAIAIVIAIGALGGVGGRSRTPTTLAAAGGVDSGRPDRKAASTPPMRRAATLPSLPGALLISDVAAEPSVIRGSTVSVSGTAVRPVGPAVVSVNLGAATLGSAVRVIGSGPFTVRVPVYSPNAPVSVDVVVRPDRPGAEPLAIQSLRLASNGAVETWSIVSHPTNGICRTFVDGPAPLTLGSVAVRIVEGRSSVASAVAPVTLDTAFDGGRLLGLGRWHAELDRPVPMTVRGAVAPWLEIDWRDPIDGTAGTLMADLPGCVGPTSIRLR